MTFTEFWKDLTDEVLWTMKDSDFFFWSSGRTTSLSIRKMIEFGELTEQTEQQIAQKFNQEYCSRGIYQDPTVYELLTGQTVTKTDDPLEVAQPYETFYKSVVEIWERKVMRAIEKVDIERLYTLDVSKTFGQFLQGMFNAVNTLAFVGKVEKYVKHGLTNGMEAAEEDMGVQVGWIEPFDQKMKTMVSEQLTGYTINGKKWHGIQGATQELQQKILTTVQNGVSNKKDRDEIVKEVQDIFGSTKSQAERIARTETTRFMNEGKMTSYQEIGVGLKTWDAVHDNHTSALCTRLSKKYANGIPHDEPFVDDITGKHYDYPPAHPNCRSVLGFRLPDG